MIPSSTSGRVIAPVLLAWIVLQAPAPAPPPPQPHGSQDYVISREVDLVVLPVTVMNGKGEFVSGLQHSDFRVYENGRPQAITYFRSEDAPVTVGLVIDRSGSMRGKSSEVLGGAKAFVEESNPQGKEFVVNFADQVSFGLPAGVPFTGNANDLWTALATPFTSGRTALYDAVIAALRHLESEPARKKVIILISDGGDNASRHSFAEALRMAQGGNVAIYTIGLFDENSADKNPKILRQFASETGGLIYLPSTPADVARVCRQIARDIRHQYTIGYSPGGQDSNAYRRIKVNVTASGRGKLTVRTRAGYFWDSKEPANSSSAAGAAP